MSKIQKIEDILLPTVFYVGMFLLILNYNLNYGAMFIWGSLITIISIFILYR